MNLQLLAAACDLITPESVESNSGASGITFSSDPRYKMYTIDLSYLSKTNDLQGLYGTWTSIVSSDKLGEGGNEPYTYEAIVESRLQMTVRPDREVYYAGDPVSLSAAITLDGRPVTNAAVTMCINSPRQFADNWLAAAKVTNEEYQKTAKTLAGQDVTALFIKAYAARLKGITFEPFTTSKKIAMTDPDNNGVYEATDYRTQTPGMYTFYVTAIGQTEDGILFRREKEIQVRVGVWAELESSLVDIDYHQVLDRDRTFIAADIKLWLKDRFDNVLLVDPKINHSMVMKSEGSKFTGPLIGNHDGSYSRSLHFTPNIVPSFSLQIYRQEIIREFKLAPIERLYYVDQVMEFQKGDEAEKGANKYSDPQALLGDVTKKDSERFVSLGGFGSITVRVQDKYVNDGIIIFIRRDQWLCPYLVEAQAVGSKGGWIELGTSPGVTQSFSLGRAGLHETAAIRITDRSGFTVDSDLHPVTSPGVSIRGVGAKRVGRPSGSSI
jgi:hypothetical protein